MAVMYLGIGQVLVLFIEYLEAVQVVLWWGWGKWDVSNRLRYKLVRFLIMIISQVQQLIWTFSSCAFHYKFTITLWLIFKWDWIQGSCAVFIVFETQHGGIVQPRPLGLKFVIHLCITKSQNHMSVRTCPVGKNWSFQWFTNAPKQTLEGRVFTFLPDEV